MIKGVKCWNLLAIILMFLSQSLLSSCSSVVSSVKETQTIKINLDTLRVKVPELSESLEMERMNDSIFYVIKLDREQKDTTIKILFNQKTKRLQLKVRQPDIKIIKADTTKIITRDEIRVEKESFLEKFFNYLIVLGVIAVIIIGLLKYKYKGIQK